MSHSKNVQAFHSALKLCRITIIKKSVKKKNLENNIDHLPWTQQFTSTFMFAIFQLNQFFFAEDYSNLSQNGRNCTSFYYDLCNVVFLIY